MVYICRLKALVLQNRRLLSKYAAEVVVQVRDMEESHGTLSESRKEPPRHVNICAFNRPRGFSDGQGPSDVLKLFIQPRQFEVFYMRWTGEASGSIVVNIDEDLEIFYLYRPQVQTQQLEAVI